MKEERKEGRNEGKKEENIQDLLDSELLGTVVEVLHCSRCLAKGASG